MPNALRWLLVALQAITLMMTWPTWGVRSVPPLLPLCPVPQFAWGPILLAALALVAVRPRFGLPLYATLWAAAMVADQTRMQPHLLSMFYLTCGTAGLVGGVLIARASLAALWFFAGIHKLTSPYYFTETAPWLLESLAPGAAPTWALTLGAAIGLAEVTLGVGCFIPACRKYVGVAAALFHAATLLVLSPLVLDWNREVWPWNLALACAAPALILPWHGPGLGAQWSAASRWAQGAAVALLVLPWGYWLGVVDPLLAHCLYSDNAPRAYVCSPEGRTEIRLVCEALGVQVPPAHRHFEPLFLGVGSYGKWLEVEDPRWIARVCGYDRRTVRWEALLPQQFEIVAPQIGGLAAPPDAAR